MSDKATLEYQGKTYEFPIIKGSEGELGIDIGTLRASTNMVTLDPGFKNTAACQSAITFLNGEEGVLRYRGYAIEELAEKASFLEVAYLLIFETLPNTQQLTQFQNDIRQAAHVDAALKTMLDAFPQSAHPMGILAALTSASAAFNPAPINIASEAAIYNAIVKIMAQFPILVAWAQCKKKGLPLNESDTTIDYMENFHKMMFKTPQQAYKKDTTAVEALNKLLILHADHEQNCSTSSVRIVGSSRVTLFAVISAGIAALWGPVHGGANQRVVEMLETIQASGGDTIQYVNKAKDKNDPFKLMGFGHRVYKNFDPRAKLVKSTTHQILSDLGVEDPIVAIAKRLEKEALNDPYFVERKLYPNIDFYSGVIYKALGIHIEMFTAMFAFGRLPGWMAQWREMRLRQEPLGRPRQIYIGATHRPFVPLQER